MLRLSLVRHAKSSWDAPGLTDFERPLNERGLLDAPVMAARIRDAGLVPARMLSSPALRAIGTARTFAEGFGVPAEEIQCDARIYDASIVTLFEVARGFGSSCAHLMMFGHNPGFSEFAQQLADCPFEEMPTCAIAVLDLDARRWSAIAPRCGRLARYLFPKDGER